MNDRSDRSIMAESPSELQAALNANYLYCQTWELELEVNATKTKVVVFSRGKCRSNKPIFSFGSKKLETVDEYVYLGVKFNYNGKFNKSNQYICEKGTKAMFSMLRKATKLNLSIDLKQSGDKCVLLRNPLKKRAHPPGTILSQLIFNGDLQFVTPSNRELPWQYFLY